MTTENEELENKEVEEDESADELLAAISEAVDEVTPDDVIEANKATNEVEEGAEQTAEEIAAAEKAADDKAAEETAAAEAFEKLSPEEKVAFEKAADDKATEEAAEKADPINDPIPESTKAETATRIRSLIDLTKEATGKAEAATGQANEIVERITETGADAAQYANTLGFLSLYNSKDPAMRKQALAAAEGVVNELRIDLGVGTVDLLDKHDDLKAKVEADTLSQEDAIEIATSREKKVLDDARIADAANTKDNDEQTQRNIDAGKAQLVTLEKTLRASDEDYDKLRPAFLQMLRPALRKAHATEWGEVAQEIYTALKKVTPVAAETPEPVVPIITPLRPHGSGGGSANKNEPPASALDALNEALGEV